MIRSLRASHRWAWVLIAVVAFLVLFTALEARGQDSGLSLIDGVL